MKLCNKCKGDQLTDGATLWVVGKCEKCGREGGVADFPDEVGGKNGGKNSGKKGAYKGEAPLVETPDSP